jgi:hypothetical protein
VPAGPWQQAVAWAATVPPPRPHPTPRGAAARPRQGLPEGHTRPCYPIQSPGVGQHRATISRDQEAHILERRRVALIAPATNVHVSPRRRVRA